MVFGKNSPKTKTTKVMIIVEANSDRYSLEVSESGNTFTSTPVISDVKMTSATLLPTNIVLRKSAGFSKKRASINPRRVPLFFFNSTLSLLEEINAISDPEKMAERISETNIPIAINMD